MLRIIIEIDGGQVATTIAPESMQPEIAGSQTIEPPGMMPPPELMARASAIGAVSAGPAPVALGAPVASMVTVAPLSRTPTSEAISATSGGMDAGSAPEY